ncbi:MAG: acetolactate synthase small subunit [Spirochaetes bacterium]|nr:acetolactate synthase small subunit [Spirochaetota bacterium]
MERRFVIACLVENHFGVLARISGLFSARGFNIDSLTVGATEDPSISRMTIVVLGDERIMEQVKKQLNKLIDVIKVLDLSSNNYVDRELALIKINITKESRMSALQLFEVFQAKVVDITLKSVTAEVSGSTQKIAAFIEMLKPFGIIETARTGKIALTRESVNGD